MRELINNTIVWAGGKDILKNGSAERQMLKAVSEIGELADEILKGDKEKQTTEMGDVIVTMIVTGALLGIDIEEALQAAYNKIANRQGETVNGVFIKKDM